MRDGGKRAFVVTLASIVLCLGAGANGIAAEPDGPLRFGFAWSEPDPEVRRAALSGAGAVLHVDLTPYVTWADAVLEVHAPPGVDVLPLAVGSDDRRVRSRVRDDGSVVWTVQLGSLGRGERTSLGFDCRVAGDRGAVVSFAVRGTDAAGRERTDAAGFAVGRPGAAPSRRHGAIEFPAVTLPDDPRVGDGDS